MKRIAAFLIGFFVVIIPSANYLARKDPEPDMAGLSLLIFGFLGALVSLGAFTWFANRAQVLGGSVFAFLVGVVCATAFIFPLGFVGSGLSLFSAWGLSFILALLVATVSPMVARSCA